MRKYEKILKIENVWVGEYLGDICLYILQEDINLEFRMVCGLFNGQMLVCIIGEGSLSYVM